MCSLRFEHFPERQSSIFVADFSSLSAPWFQPGSVTPSGAKEILAVCQKACLNHNLFETFANIPQPLTMSTVMSAAKHTHWYCTKITSCFFLQAVDVAGHVVDDFNAARLPGRRLSRVGQPTQHCEQRPNQSRVIFNLLGVNHDASIHGKNVIVSIVNMAIERCKMRKIFERYQELTTSCGISRR